MRNCISVLGLRLTAKMLNIFVDIFMVLYLWDLSDGSISVLCQYYITFVFFIWLSMLITTHLFAKKHCRKLILVFSRILQLFYFALVYILGSRCVENIPLIAIINGIVTGMYYGIYNIYEAEGIDNNIRTKVMGYYGVVDGIIAISFPIITGIIIENYGMQTGLIMAVIATVLSIILASLYIDNGISIGDVFSIKHLIEILKHDNKYKKGFIAVAKADTYKAFINSYGSFEMFTQVYTMMIFKAAVEVGYISGISTAFKILFSLIFARIANKVHSKSIKAYIVLRVLVIISLISMGFTGSIIFLIIMTLTMKCSDAIESPIYGSASATLSNTGDISKYKSEFYMLLETILTAARITGYAMLWLWGHFNGTITLAMCICVYSITLVAAPIVEDMLYRIVYKVE